MHSSLSITSVYPPPTPSSLHLSGSLPSSLARVPLNGIVNDSFRLISQNGVRATIRHRFQFEGISFSGVTAAGVTEERERSSESARNRVCEPQSRFADDLNSRAVHPRDSLSNGGYIVRTCPNPTWHTLTCPLGGKGDHPLINSARTMRSATQYRTPA